MLLCVETHFALVRPQCLCLTDGSLASIDCSEDQRMRKGHYGLQLGYACLPDTSHTSLVGSGKKEEASCVCCEKHCRTNTHRHFYPNYPSPVPPDDGLSYADSHCSPEEESQKRKGEVMERWRLGVYIDRSSSEKGETTSHAERQNETCPAVTCHTLEMDGLAISPSAARYLRRPKMRDNWVWSEEMVQTNFFSTQTR